MALSRDSPTVPDWQSSGTGRPDAGQDTDSSRALADLDGKLAQWTVRIGSTGRYEATTRPGIEPPITVSGRDLAELRRRIRQAVLRAMV